MTRIPRLPLLAVLILASFAVLASPPPKMNLSGRWVLDVEKSDFGGLMPPKSRIDDITQKDAHFLLRRTQVSPTDSSTTVTVDCVIGDGDCKAEYSSPDAQLKVRAAWEGEALGVDSVLSSSGVDIKVHDLYTLSADGKVLTIKRHIATVDGEADQTQILNKQ